MQLPGSSNIERISTRHRILIVAAVAATVGNVEIRDIRPAAWTRRRAAGVRTSPVVRHQNSPVESDAEEEEETACDS